MANEKRLIALDEAKKQFDDIPPFIGITGKCVQDMLDNVATVDAVPAEQFNTLKSLVNGEWVDCKLLQEALSIDFATGLKMFDFSRTAEWNPAPLNGQKITTKFRIKNAVEVVHGQMEEVEIVPNYMWKYRCSCCYSDGERWYKYCPNCGSKMKEGNEDG